MKLKKKKIIAASVISFIALSIVIGIINRPPQNSNAMNDYLECNMTYADGSECTEEEFRDFLIYDVEYNSFVDIDEATPETQQQIVNEISEKVDDIFN